MGDTKKTRDLLGLLKDRRKFPVKVLVFASDSRPGYCGKYIYNLDKQELSSYSFRDLDKDIGFC